MDSRFQQELAGGFLPLQLQDAGINESDTAFNKAATSIDDIAGILLHPQISSIGQYFC
jgi:hypothetical protein